MSEALQRTSAASTGPASHQAPEPPKLRPQPLLAMERNPHQIGPAPAHLARSAHGHPDEAQTSAQRPRSGPDAATPGHGRRGYLTPTPPSSADTPPGSTTPIAGRRKRQCHQGNPSHEALTRRGSKDSHRHRAGFGRRLLRWHRGRGWRGGLRRGRERGRPCRRGAM
jgi:hypothetical protein